MTPAACRRAADGWPNRDLNVGAIIAAAHNLGLLADHMGIAEGQLRQVLNS
jgi:hypothetical protein